MRNVHVEKYVTQHQPTAMIFAIEGHAVHDGPGCRTLVFLSGCPLRCRYCSNPEGQTIARRLMFRSSNCRCRTVACDQGCPHGAITVTGRGADRHVTIDRTACSRCESLTCTEHCYHEALVPAGQRLSLAELMRILGRDRDYWGTDGGVTFGGGEPFVQHEFLLAALKSCRDAHIPSAVETCGFVQRLHLETALPHIDWLFVDIKHMDTATHETETGVGNSLILDNIRWISQSNWPGRLIIRTTIIPGINDSRSNLDAQAQFMIRCGLKEINLLPFHRLGTSKYDQLGVPFGHADTPSPSDDAMEFCARPFRDREINCYVGSDTPF